MPTSVFILNEVQFKQNSVEGWLQNLKKTSVAVFEEVNVMCVSKLVSVV